ncbi:hypothetical protein LSH36_383g00001 [Paralvinella palmiformis]|uniref:Uncharacterized protein n=1 Tax=Paralvinella palmiformis TaxID=53620 RepID=A0AAD9JCY9_9ANNE|nr:hypothetical protein LSH36_383g00001 [Paralvinella palmiformis]
MGLSEMHEGYVVQLSPGANAVFVHYTVHMQTHGTDPNTELWLVTKGDQQQYRAPALHHCTQISILVSAGDDDGEDNDDDDDDEDDDGGAGTKSSASYHRLVLYNSQDDIQHRYLVDNDH